MRRWFVVLLGLVLPLTAVRADVVGSSANGFEIKRTVLVAADPGKLWSTLIAPASWWDPAHSWSGSAANLTIDPRPGGCFCEKLPGGGGVEHMRVIYSAPGQQLRMAGSLGPLQGEGATGTLTIEIAPAPHGSAVTLRYVVGGYLSMGAQAVAPAVDQVLGEQLMRLKAAAERRVR